MVLYVAKSSFSQDVAHISFPAEADQVRNEVIAVEEFSGWAPAQIIGGEGAAQALAGHLERDALFSEEGVQKLNQLAGLVDAMDLEAQKVFAGALTAEHARCLDDALRVAGSLDSYELFPGIKTDEDLGRFLVDTAPITGKFIFAEEAKPYLDYAKIGEGYGLKTYTCKTIAELEAALEDAKKQTVACLFDLKVIPKTMTDGYESWWNVGLADVSEKESVRKAWEGVKAGRWLEGHLRDKGVTGEETVNIVVLTGTEGASSAIGRSEGFREVARDHANWKILEEKCADFTSAKGKEVMEGFLRKYPEIDVVVSQNDDMTFGAIEAIQEAGRTVGVHGEISIISFDAVHDALEMVAAGTINVDIECNPNQGGYLSQVISMLEKGQEVEKDYYVEEDVFTIDNVTEEVLRERNY